MGRAGQPAHPFFEEMEMSVSKGLMAEIEYRRKECGMSKAELYRQAGVSKAAYEFWVSGARKPSVENLDKLGRVFGITLEWAML